MAKQRLARPGLDDRTLIIFGVDPGKETGVVVYTHGKLIGRVQLPAADVISWIVNRLLEIDITEHRIVIAVERYNIGTNTVKKTRQTDPLEIIGQLRAVARNSSIFFTTPNQADTKKIGRDAVLRRIGWFTQDQAGHINDAARVALHTLAVERPNEYASVVGL